LLVVDAGAMARSAAAIVHGYATFDPELRVAGVILNRVGSPTHERMLREAIEPLNIPVLGVLGRDANLNSRTAISASSPPPSVGKRPTKRSTVRAKRSPAPATSKA
jgi:nitrogenase subunit NifH